MEKIEEKKEKKINVSEFLLEKLYNRKDKELFLEEYLTEDNSREMYTVFLNQAGEWENIIKKDLYEFNEKDVENLFANAYTNSPNSLRALFSTCKQYLNWATNDKLLNRTGENPFEILNFKKDIMPMLNTKDILEKYISEEEVWAIQNRKETINAQDFICIILPFYGIKSQMCSEIVNLKRSDVDGVNNKITLVNKIIYETTIDPITKVETKIEVKRIMRTIPISKRLIKSIEDADDQIEYMRRGKMGFGDRDSCMLFENSEYVVKPTTKNGFPYVTAQTVATRSKKNLSDVGFKNISINDLVISGKIHVLNQIEKNENREVSIEDYKYVQELFAENSENYANIKQTFELYKKAISKAD